VVREGMDIARPVEAAPLTVTVPQAARLVGISVSKMYAECLEGGQFAPCVVRVGARVLLSRARLERLLNGEPVAS
jgi:Helix-turn-helix domain